MKIKSNYFGELDFNDEKVIKFENAIPGFDEIHKFFIITEDGVDNAAEDDDEERLFCWLHSVEDPDVAFALLDVFKVKSDYKPEIEEEYLTDIGFVEGDEIAVYNIVNIPEKIDEMTVNLIAPIVINLSKMLGRQVILSNEEYSLKHKIFEDIKKLSKHSDTKEV